LDCKQKFISNKSLLNHSEENNNSNEIFKEDFSDYISEMEEDKSSSKKDCEDNNKEEIVALASCLNTSNFNSQGSDNHLSDDEKLSIKNKNFKQSVTKISLTSSLKCRNIL
jgi:hypothetical protein